MKVQIKAFALQGRAAVRTMAAMQTNSGANSRAETSARTTAPLRVLHVQNTADIYGASRALARLLNVIDRTRFTPLVVLPEAGPLKEMLEVDGIEVVIHRRMSIITRPVFKSWRIIQFALNFPISVFWFWRLIRHRRIDLVHTNTGVILSPSLAAWLAGVPHVWHIRDWFQEFRGIWPAFASYIRRFSRKIICISNAVAGQFKHRDNVVVIHDGFSLAEFQVPKAGLGRQFRAHHGLGEAFIVGCVGRIKLVRKGQEELVRATALLKQRGRLLKALIVGAPFPGNESHLVQIQKLVRDLGVEDDVVFTGELADVRPAYAAMDVFAMTSAQPEPLGGVMMEAMSLELPVIATNIGGPLELVVEGVTGLLVPPGDAPALADAIEKLMVNAELRRQMGVAGRDRIENYFSLTEAVKKTESVFEEAMVS